MCVEGSAAVNASAIPLAVRGPTAEQHKLDACDTCLLQQSNTKLMAVTLVFAAEPHMFMAVTLV